jgi:hypothetical protein
MKLPVGIETVEKISSTLFLRSTIQGDDQQTPEQEDKRSRLAFIQL